MDFSAYMLYFNKIYPPKALGLKMDRDVGSVFFLFKILLWLSTAFQLKSKLPVTAFQGLPCGFWSLIVFPASLTQASVSQTCPVLSCLKVFTHALPTTFPRTPTFFAACLARPKQLPSFKLSCSFSPNISTVLQ